MLTWRRGSSAHRGRGSSSRRILRGRSSDACSSCCCGNCPSALRRHHLDTHTYTEGCHTHTHTHLFAAQPLCLPWLPAVKVLLLLWLAQLVLLEPEASELLQGRHDPPLGPHPVLQPRPPTGHELYRSGGGDRFNIKAVDRSQWKCCIDSSAEGNEKDVCLPFLQAVSLSSLYRPLFILDQTLSSAGSLLSCFTIYNSVKCLFSLCFYVLLLIILCPLQVSRVDRRWCGSSALSSHFTCINHLYQIFCWCIWWPT